jgi:hypothetical protein
MSINNLQDMTNFFNKLQGFATNKNNDGVLTKEEVEQAYGAMLCQPGDQIPQAIKDKFATACQFSAAFDCIDPLGIKDGFINDQELYKYVNGNRDPHFKPWTPPGTPPVRPQEPSVPKQEPSQNDMIAFFEKLESKTQNKDGVLTHVEASDAYQKLLSEDPGAIPDQVKNKLGSQGLSDLGTFNQIDEKGSKDGFINWQELHKYVTNDNSFHPWVPPNPDLSTPDFAAAGYLVKNGNVNDAHASSQKLVTDVEGLLGAANDGGTPDSKLSKAEIASAITQVQAHRDTVGSSDAKLKILKFLYRNFDQQSEGGSITAESLSKNLRNSAVPDGSGWS